MKRAMEISREAVRLTEELIPWDFSDYLNEEEITKGQYTNRLAHAIFCTNTPLVDSTNEQEDLLYGLIEFLKDWSDDEDYGNECCNLLKKLTN